MATPDTTLIPPPDIVRQQLAQLMRQTDLTRRLLNLSLRAYAPDADAQQRQGGRQGVARAAS